MSHQGLHSEGEDPAERTTTVYHADFARQALPSQYQATDIVHQATSDTPHHPSRPPNFIQPWRTEHPSSRHTVSERTYPGPPEATRTSSMGNKNDSDKGSASRGNIAVGSDKDDLMRTAEGRERGQPEAAGGGPRENQETTTPVSHPMQSHSSEWLQHNMSHTPPQDSVTVPHVVPLVTPAALADLGHLYKLPMSGLPSQPQIYPAGILNPLYTSGQYPSYVGHSTVQVTTVPTFSPYLGGHQLGYPLVAAQGTAGPGSYPTIESYSAMLASMGSQVQQAQGTRLPVSTYLPPGVISLPYGSQLTHGLPSLSLLPKGAIQESVPAVAYLNQQLSATGILQSGHHVLTSLVPVSGSILGFPPRTEDELNRLDGPQETDREQEQSSNVQMITGEDKSMQGDTEASPFPRRSFQTGPYSSTDKSDEPHSKNVRTIDSASHSSSADYQDRKPYPATSTRHESVITAVSACSDKSRPVAAKEEHPVYTTDESSHWGGHLSYHQPEEGPNPYPNSAPPAAQHSPQVRFHLSPSPQLRPSSTITHTQSAETEDVPVQAAPKPTSSHMTAYVPAADRMEQGPHQPPELMTLAPAVEPSRSQTRHIPAAPQLPAPGFNNIPCYFTRGSIIQLASGELKRVEDIRTEDFVHSAEMCEGLKIDSSTVVRINEHADNGVALISFLVGAHKAQVSLEAPMEHPFFVFGQGWSAVRPERSLKSYSLGCHKLAVGDVCVSLTVKDKNGRWVHQQQQLEQPLQQPPQPQSQQQLQQHQQQQQQQLQAPIPVQSLFSGNSKETQAWTPEPKRPRLLEPVQEDSDWKGKSDLQQDRTWHHEPQPPSSHLEAPMHYAFAAAPPPVSVNVSVEQAPVAGKVTEQIDSNANKVLIRTTDRIAEDGTGKAGPRMDARPLQPLKRRWSDPMHRAQLVADQEKYGLSTKPADPQ